MTKEGFFFFNLQKLENEEIMIELAFVSILKKESQDEDTRSDPNLLQFLTFEGQ